MRKNNAVRYRGFLGLTQSEMAEKIGVSLQAYWKKENGLTPFTDGEKVIFKNLLKEDFPNLTIDEIFFENKVLK